MMVFNDFLGNQKLKNDIEEMLKKNRLPHSIIIEGQDERDRELFSQLLTKAVMCQENYMLCDRCISCKKNDRNIHPDVFIIQSIDQKLISVDQIRNILNSLYVFPNESNKKVYVIKNAHDMTSQAQNALLKMLEEPPKFALFILTVDKTQKLLDTVVSRCVCFRLEPVSKNETIGVLGKNNATDTQKAVYTENISNESLCIKDKIEKKSKDDKFKIISIEFLRKLCFKSEFEYLNYYKELYKNKENIKYFLDELLFLLRDLLWYNNSYEKNIEYYSKYANEIKEFSELISNDALLNMIDIVDNTKEEIIQNVNFNACISVFQICIWEEVYG